jgi:hypothetical protein
MHPPPGPRGLFAAQTSACSHLVTAGALTASTSTLPGLPCRRWTADASPAARNGVQTSRASCRRLRLLPWTSCPGGAGAAIIRGTQGSSNM